MALRIALKVLDVREASAEEIDAGSVGESPFAVVSGPPPGEPLH